MAKRSKVTRTDVAKLAGVSTAVVSYVVNDGPRPVAEKTRQRVRDAIEQLGYLPSASARALKLGSTGTYGLSVPDVGNPLHAEIVEGIDRHMRERGWSMLLAHAHGDSAREKQVVADMVGRGADGMVILMTSTEDIEWIREAIPVPAVFMDRQRPLFGYVTIGPDFEDAGWQATQHLVQHGRQRIVPAYGVLYLEEKNHRLTGYRRALQEAGLPEMEPLATEWDRAGGYRAGLELLQRDPLPDAVFCFSDLIAIGMLQVLQEAGVRVPEDIAIVCFDGTPAAEFASPALTSVNQPVDAMAEAAVVALGKPAPQGFDHQVFPVSLTVRRSCGC